VLALQHLFPNMKLRKGFKTIIISAMLCNAIASFVARFADSNGLVLVHY